MFPYLQPDQVLAVRAALANQPNAQGASTDLWDSLGGMKCTDDGTLPVASVLATLSPESNGWEKHGAKVTEGLVRVDAVYLGDWLDALKEIRKSLLPSLIAIYSNRSADPDKAQSARATRATSILKEYAYDEPAVLAELLLIGDIAQANTLFPLAVRTENASAVAKLFQRELTKVVERSWDDPVEDPAWQDPDPQTVIDVEQAGGLVDLDERCAFAQSMPRQKFEQVAEQLRASGFRPRESSALRWRARTTCVSRVAARRPSVGVGMGFGPIRAA